MNEACKILEEGKAYRASDIDVMWLHGFGFPRYRGGLMFWADTTLGAKAIFEQISEWHTALRCALEAERSAARDRGERRVAAGSKGRGSAGVAGQASVLNQAAGGNLADARDCRPGDAALRSPEGG